MQWSGLQFGAAGGGRAMRSDCVRGERESVYVRVCVLLPLLTASSLCLGAWEGVGGVRRARGERL